MERSPNDLRARLALQAVPASIGMIRTAMADLAARAGANATTVASVRLAVSEAATNAVRHAYDDGRIVGEVRADGRIERSERSLLVVSISDDGPGLRPRPDSPGLGLGLPLIASAVLSLDVGDDHPGTTLCLRFALP